MQAALHELPPKLHPRLERFFIKYPPQLYAQAITGETIPLTRLEAKQKRKAELQANRQKREELEALKTQKLETQNKRLTVSTSNASQPNTPTPQPPSPSISKPAPTPKFRPNPFQPISHPKNHYWRAPRIGLRVQADLFKLARKSGVEHLLPASRKSSSFKEARILQKGLRIKGTGVGQEVKGHKEEREHPAKMERRRKALEEMPALVREWKRRGHGKGWKDWPKAKTR